MKVRDHILQYTKQAQRLISPDAIKTTDKKGKNISYVVAFTELLKIFTHIKRSAMVYFIGNGGSAGIASENANRLRKYCHIKTMTFNDAITMSASANDSKIGWPDVFIEPLKAFIEPGHILIAISSSGMSRNIINATKLAKKSGVFVVTLSGFKTNNNLRALGDFNFYIPSSDYQLVEGAHSHIIGSLANALIQVQKNNINLL